jgi:hypothetical protein
MTRVVLSAVDAAPLPSTGILLLSSAATNGPLVASGTDEAPSSLGIRIWGLSSVSTFQGEAVFKARFLSTVSRNELLQQRPCFTSRTTIVTTAKDFI